jgi:hypothetical protein
MESKTSDKDHFTQTVTRILPTIEKVLNSAFMAANDKSGVSITLSDKWLTIKDRRTQTYASAVFELMRKTDPKSSSNTTELYFRDLFNTKFVNTVEELVTDRTSFTYKLLRTGNQISGFRMVDNSTKIIIDIVRKSTLAKINTFMVLDKRVELLITTIPYSYFMGPAEFWTEDRNGIHKTGTSDKIFGSNFILQISGNGFMGHTDYSKIVKELKTIGQDAQAKFGQIHAHTYRILYNEESKIANTIVLRYVQQRNKFIPLFIDNSSTDPWMRQNERTRYRHRHPIFKNYEMQLESSELTEESKFWHQKLTDAIASARTAVKLTEIAYLGSYRFGP